MQEFFVPFLLFIFCAASATIFLKGRGLLSIIDTGERIRALRKERNLNQEQLAELASLNRVTVAKYESGRIEPGAQALSRIADALDVTVDALLGRSEDVPVVARPRTVEARIVSGGIDRLPKDQREQVLNVVRAMFAQHPELFVGGDEDGTEP